MKLPITLPFDKFVDLIETMFESNPLIVVGTTQGVIKSPSDLDIDDSILCHSLFSRGCTITSIEVRLPQFSIGDTVMIVDTGEIGYIGETSDYSIGIYSSLEGDMHHILSNNFIGKTKKENLVKIPSDLIPILQD